MSGTTTVLGFRKRSNFWLWLFFGGVLAIFSAANLRYLDLDGVFSKHSVPGGWYWYRRGQMRTGIFLHLASVLPAGCLAPLQFIPKIRHKYILLHRIIGYIVMTLVCTGIIGALMIMPHSMGGYLDTQLSLLWLAVTVPGAMFLAWYNIRRLQFDQHRKWMFRAMVWMSVIITERVILLTMLFTLPDRGWHTTWTCDEIEFTLADPKWTATLFPACKSLGPAGQVRVLAVFDQENPVYSGSFVRFVFGTTMWMAIVIHAIGVEIYLSKTKDESERLRKISVQRQLAAGMKPLLKPHTATSERTGPK